MTAHILHMAKPAPHNKPFLAFSTILHSTFKEKKKKISNDVMHDLYILGLKVRVFA